MTMWIAFLLIAGSIIAYFILSTQFGIYQRYPVLHYFVAIAGVLMAVVLLVDHFSVARLILNLLYVLFLGAFVWYTLSYSTYQKQDAKTHAGEDLREDLAKVYLKGIDGQGFNFLEALAESKATLVVFYRGIW